LFGKIVHEVFYDETILFFFGFEETILSLDGILEILECFLMMNVLSAIEGTFIMAAFRQSQMFWIEALEFGRNFRIFFFVLLLLLSDVVQPFDQDGLVEQLFSCLIISQNIFDDSITT
jgi:hypothetical protein